MIDITLNLLGAVVYGITGPWRRFCRWVRAMYLRDVISGLEDDLRILRGIRGHDSKAEKTIKDKLESAKLALHLTTRKGGV